MILACSPTQQVLGVNSAILAGCLGFFMMVIIAYGDSVSVSICPGLFSSTYRGGS